MKNLITCLVVFVMSGVVTAEVHHVPADFPTIQYAVDAALDGDEIIVAPGTYTSTADEVVNMLGKEIWLHSSGGEEVTIIDGEETRRGIYCNNGETSNTIIEGFTITNGYSMNNGGGMYNNYSSPTLTDCTFTGNSAEYGGGMRNYNSSPMLENCTFTGNIATSHGGGMYNTYSSPTLTNCTFTSNTAGTYGGGMYNSNSSPMLTNCTFTNNMATSHGGGMYNSSSSNPTLTNCTFENNTANDNGGGMWCAATTITGCAFIQNIATNGGGVFSSGSNETNSPTISNSNFCENDPEAINGNWNNGGGNEFLNTCGDIEGACCVKEACYEVEFLFCDAIGGEWLGYNATCEEDTCTDSPQYGACCINGEAIPLYDYDCNRILGIFMGKGTDPADVTCPLVCAEDVNGDGLINVSDLLAIISVWGACP